MTFETTPIQDAYGMLSDIHKDAYGYRPKGKYSSTMTIEEVYDEINKLQLIVDKNADEERILEEANKVKFEGLIERTIQMGAGNRKTALRWLIEAEDELYDYPYFIWQQGLGCGEIAESYIQEIEKIFA